MPSDALPFDVRTLLEERTRAREARAWARADALRDELTSLGWQAEDGPSGSTARPILATVGGAGETPLDGAASVAASLQVAAEDHPDDLARLLAGLADHPPSDSWELVVVANRPTFDVDELLRSSTLAVEPTVV